MERQRLKTGKYGIGTMIHSVHMTDDVPALNTFYEDVFGGLMYMGIDEPNYLPPEDRWAGLVQISDLCIETMAPNTPVDATKPVGKFFSKYGKHLHSVGYTVDDLVGLGNELIGKGVYIGRPGGGRSTRWTRRPSTSTRRPATPAASWSSCARSRCATTRGSSRPGPRCASTGRSGTRSASSGSPGSPSASRTSTPR